MQIGFCGAVIKDVCFVIKDSNGNSDLGYELQRGLVIIALVKSWSWCLSEDTKEQKEGWSALNGMHTRSDCSHTRLHTQGPSSSEACRFVTRALAG